MEQLAYFVTKTFEYNNTSNRVFEIINMTTKFDSEKLIEKCEKDESMDEDESVDIDITDNASDNESVDCQQSVDLSNSNGKCDKDRTLTSEKSSTILIEEQKHEEVVEESPLPLVKKVIRDGSRLITRNWLIGDCPKKKAVAEFCNNSENQENRHSEVNIIRVEDLISNKNDNKSKSPAGISNSRSRLPSNELLLKQIREINNLSPSQNSNGDLKKELVDDEKIKSGEEIHFTPFNPFKVKYSDNVFDLNPRRFSGRKLI